MDLKRPLNRQALGIALSPVLAPFRLEYVEILYNSYVGQELTFWVKDQTQMMCAGNFLST